MQSKSKTQSIVAFGIKSFSALATKPLKQKSAECFRDSELCVNESRIFAEREP